MSRRFDIDWSGRRARAAVLELLRIGREERYDPQVRVNALATVLQCCGEDITQEEPTRAVGFRGGEE